AKNAHTVKVHESKSVSDERLPESHYVQVVYWNTANESETGFVDINKPEVIMRLTKDRISVLDVNKEIPFQD
ncbi:18229_t:CDS:1, partial [Racocetra persica]